VQKDHLISEGFGRDYQAVVMHRHRLRLPHP
jgi:hypothetical protein